MKALVFVDVTDAWSYVGSVRFERAAALFTIMTGEAVEIVYRACGPGTSVSAEEVAVPARISGLDLNVEELVPADSTDAWRLLTWAAETGPEAQRDLLHELWRAHFLEGVDLEDHFALASRAALAGLSLRDAEGVLSSGLFAAEVAAQRDMAIDLGIDELPYIVVDVRWTISGPHSQDDYVRTLRSLPRERPDDLPPGDSPVSL